MAGCADTSAPGPNYNSGSLRTFSNVSEELKALLRRQNIAAELGLPLHNLPSSRPLQQGGHRQRRAARLAGVMNKYHPQLRAEATSAAVGASNAVQAGEQQQWFPSMNRTTFSQRKDTAAGAGTIFSSRNLGEISSSLNHSSLSELLDGFDYDLEFSWATLVSSTMQRFYRLLRADSKPEPKADSSTGYIVGQSDRVGNSCIIGAKGSDCAKDLRCVLDNILQHLARHPASDIANRLMSSRPNPQTSQTAASRPFTLQTIYTGVADTKCTGYDTLPGRAAVMIGLHGALAMESLSLKGPSGAENRRMESRTSSESPWHAAREAHLRSAMLLADAVLQRHSAGTLTFPELRCLVTVITRLQPIVVLDLVGAATTSHATATSSLELLVALAKTLASAILPSMDVETFQNDLSSHLVLQHEAAVLEAMKVAKDLHISQPARFVECYLRGFAAYGQAKLHGPLPSEKALPQGPTSRPSCKGEDDVQRKGKEGIEDPLKYAALLRRGLEQMTEILLLRQHAAAGGRGAPLRLSGGLVPPEDTRRELVRMLLAVSLEASRHSLVAVGGEAMKLVLANVAALGYFRSESAKMVLELSQAAIAADGTSEKASDVIHQQVLPSAVSVGNAVGSVGSTTLLSHGATDDASLEDCKRSISFGSATSNSSSSFTSSSSSSNMRAHYVEASATSVGRLSPCAAMAEGILAVRLMTSAQLVTQHCPEVAKAVERAARTPTGYMDAGDANSGGQRVDSAGGFQLPDPYCMPEGVPFVAAVTVLPLSAALTQHISRLSALEDAQHICEPMPVKGWSDVHNWQVQRLWNSMRKRHIASMVGFTERGVERMVVLAAKVSAELLREGIDVVVVPELFMPCAYDLKQIMESMKCFIANNEQNRTNGGRYDEPDDGYKHTPGQPNYSSASEVPVRTSERLPEAANLPPVHDTLRHSMAPRRDPEARLRPDWQLQRRFALIGISSALLNLRGSSMRYAQFLQHELLERYARLDESVKPSDMAGSGTDACAHSTTYSMAWDHIRRVAERQRRWLCDRVGMVRLKLTLVAFEVGQGGELGKILPSLRTS